METNVSSAGRTQYTNLSTSGSVIIDVTNLSIAFVYMLQLLRKKNSKTEAIPSQGSRGGSKRLKNYSIYLPPCTPC